MTKVTKILFAAGVLATVAATATPARLPDRLPLPGGDNRPLPKPKPLACKVDPAISSLTVYKGSQRGSVQVVVVVKNLGTGTWQSGEEQQSVTVKLLNLRTNAESVHRVRLAANAAPLAEMARLTTPMVENAFDHLGSAGTLEAKITYDPDIMIDGNSCNDDANLKNNRRFAEQKDISNFLIGVESVRSF
jgi:hypothetical protein